MAKTLTIIQSKKSFKNYLNTLWQYRQLLFFLSWRDILIRYKQTVMGITWSVIRPLLTSLILYFIFNRVVGLSADQTPYILVVFSGMVAWQFFSNTLNESSNSLISNTNLITKVYFPRILLPASSLLSNLLDTLITLIIFFILFIFYRQSPTVNILVLPVLVIWTIILTLGLGLIFSSLNAKYRDFKYILPFGLQFWLYLSPVGFISSNIPAVYRLFYYLNPLAGLIDVYRWCLLNLGIIYLPGIVLSLVVGAFLFFTGVIVFFNTERILADTI